MRAKHRCKESNVTESFLSKNLLEIVKSPAHQHKSIKRYISRYIGYLVTLCFLNKPLLYLPRGIANTKMMKMMKKMEGKVNVGEENQVGEGVIGTMMMIVMTITTRMMTTKIDAVEREIIVREENVVAERVIGTMTMIVMMITTGMMTTKIDEIEPMEGVVIVGEEDVVGVRVVRTMMTIVMMTTKKMIGEVIVRRNVVEEKAARIVG